MGILKSILLIFLAISSPAIYGQLKHTTFFSKQSEINSHCSQSILLDSLGYFFKEKGCEGTSTISFGRYKIGKNNVVSFFFLSIDSLQPFKEIRRYKDTNDSLLTFTLYDREGNPLSQVYNFEAVGKNGETQTIRSDEEGKIRLNRKLYTDLVITPLIWIYQQQAPLASGDENNIEVHLALPTMFLMYQQITFEKPTKQQLILKKGGLYKLDGKTQLYSIDKKQNAQ